MRHLLVFALFGLAGAHFPTTLDALQGGSPAGPPYGSAWADEPLRAAVWFDEYTGLASFELNRPAHVALFALRPLGAIEMVYPHWGRGAGGGLERAFRAGRHSVRTRSEMYRLVDARGHRRSVYRTAGQTYIVLIASDRPLDLGHFLATGTVPWLNHPSVTWSPFVATDHLADAIVRGRGSGHWVAAYHVIWPEARLRGYHPAVPYTRVRCPGGIVISISTQVLRSDRWACPDRYVPRHVPRRRPESPRTARPRGSGAPPITSTLPKRPRPEDWRRATPPRADRPALPGKRPTRPAHPARPARPVRPVTPVRPTPPAVPRRRPVVPPRDRARPRAPSRPAPAAKPAPKTKTRPKKGGGSGGGV